jgi:hypothetical protein
MAQTVFGVISKLGLVLVEWPVLETVTMRGHRVVGRRLDHDATCHIRRDTALRASRVHDGNEFGLAREEIGAHILSREADERTLRDSTCENESHHTAAAGPDPNQT